MFGWFKAKPKAEESDGKFSTEVMKAAVEGDRLHRIRQAIATIDSQPLYGKDATERAASAAAVLTKAIVAETGVAINNDDDLFVAGIFSFVFADYFAMLLTGQFETASSLAVLMLIGPEEFHRGFSTLQEDYNRMIQSKPGVIEAIGKSCETWFKSPTPENFQQLTGLFKLLRDHVAQK
jgi:hypothetical protein